MTNASIIANSIIALDLPTDTLTALADAYDDRSRDMNASNDHSDECRDVCDMLTEYLQQS